MSFFGAVFVKMVKREQENLCSLNIIFGRLLAILVPGRSAYLALLYAGTADAPLQSTADEHCPSVMLKAVALRLTPSPRGLVLRYVYHTLPVVGGTCRRE